MAVKGSGEGFTAGGSKVVRVRLEDLKLCRRIATADAFRSGWRTPGIWSDAEVVGHALQVLLDASQRVPHSKDEQAAFWEYVDAFPAALVQPGDDHTRPTLPGSEYLQEAIRRWPERAIMFDLLTEPDAPPHR